MLGVLTALLVGAYQATPLVADVMAWLVAGGLLAGVVAKAVVATVRLSSTARRALWRPLLEREARSSNGWAGPICWGLTAGIAAVWMVLR